MCRDILAVKGHKRIIAKEDAKIERILEQADIRIKVFITVAAIIRNIMSM